ncbi:hypothetical protein GCM10023324_59360 [Streptomyces youssoufiensis]
MGVAGVEAGDDHGIEYVVVQAAKAQVRQGLEAGGEQGDRLVAPAADGGLGHVVAAGPVGQAPVVAQHGRDEHRDLSGGRIRHLDRIAFRWRRSRSARWLTVPVVSGRRHR